MNNTPVKLGVRPRTEGFSLVELAVVLVVVSFLLGGLLIPLSSQISQRDREDTVGRLEQAREALLGFALTKGYLPCPMDPDTTKPQADPTNNTYGEESRTGNVCTKNAGILPWKALGLSSGVDAWGHERLAQADGWIGFGHQIQQNQRMKSVQTRNRHENLH